MPWKRNGHDGLIFDGGAFDDEPGLLRLIDQLRSRRRRNPDTICALLQNLIRTKRIEPSSPPLRKSTPAGRRGHIVWRLSKWCDWEDESAPVARSIAARLFGGVVCRRLLDQNDRPTPDAFTAEADYQTWISRVAQQPFDSSDNHENYGDIDPRTTYPEGAVRKILINSYERCSTARRRCIEHHGSKCCVCGFDFGAAYDGVGDGFIHVHHLRKLSEVGPHYEVDYIADLRPVCANCHAIIHLYKEPFSIDDVKFMVERSRARRAP